MIRLPPSFVANAARFSALDFAAADIDGKGRDARQALALAVFDVESACTAVRTEAPLRGHRRPFTGRQGLLAGLPEAPTLPTVGRIVQLVAVAVRSRAAVDDQAPAVLRGKRGAIFSA